jgi:hypothetical protein
MEEEKGCQSDLGRFPKTYPLISEINGIAEMIVLFVFRWTTQEITFSQEYAKSSCRDICSIPIQANTAGEESGISFDLNNTVVQISKVFNAKRNTHFI